MVNEVTGPESYSPVRDSSSATDSSASETSSRFSSEALDSMRALGTSLGGRVGGRDLPAVFGGSTLTLTGDGEDSVVGRGLRAADAIAGRILGRVSSGEATERIRDAVLGSPVPESKTNPGNFRPEGGVYSPAGAPGIGDVSPGVSYPGRTETGDGNTAIQNRAATTRNNGDGTLSVSYEGSLATKGWNPFSSDTKFSGTEKWTTDQKMLERHVSYDQDMSLKFKTPDGPKEIDRVRSVDTKYDPATKAYDTVISTSDGKHYRAETSPDGRATEFKETSANVLDKLPVLSTVLNGIPEGVMNDAQKAQLKHLLLDSTNVDFNPADNSFHVTRSQEGDIGPLHLGKDLSFKIGMIPPTLTDIQGVTAGSGLATVQVNRLQLGFDEAGRPVVRPTVSGWGMEGTTPAISLGDILSSGH